MFLPERGWYFTSIDVSDCFSAIRGKAKIEMLPIGKQAESRENQFARGKERKPGREIDIYSALRQLSLSPFKNRFTVPQIRTFIKRSSFRTVPCYSTIVPSSGICLWPTNNYVTISFLHFRRSGCCSQRNVGGKFGNWQNLTWEIETLFCWQRREVYYGVEDN